MFGQLLESSASRQRRSGGAALSVAAHVAIIGAAAVATASGTTTRREPERPVIIHITPPPAPAKPVKRRPVIESRHATSVPAFASIPVIEVPRTVPTTLPTIDASMVGQPAFDSVAIGPAGSGRSGRRGVLDVGDDTASGGEWRGNELMMRIISSGKPRYPEPLRQAGIDGHVLVQFTVDTLGYIDMSSVQVLKSTHDLFSRAVRDVLPSFRFKPAEVRGKRVRSLAQMPFEFSISR